MNVLLIIFLTLLNGVFAMSELAVASSSRARLEAMRDAGDALAGAALDLMVRPTRFLSTVQVGITSIGLLNGIVGEAAFSAPLAARLQQWGMPEGAAALSATALVVICITFVTIIFGELAPKRIGQMFPEAVARWVAYPMRWLAAATAPFVALLSVSTRMVLKLLRLSESNERPVTAEEISASLEEGVDAGLIEAQEHQMVRNVFHLDLRPLSSLMVRRDEIEWLDADLSVAQALQQVAARGEKDAHSWYAVCHESLDEVTGIISVARLLALGQQCEGGIGERAEEAIFVPETLSAMELLEQLRTRPARIMFVVDEYGVVQGMMTPRDLLEAITGELKSEGGDDWAQPLKDGGWMLDGLMPASELKARLNIDELPRESKGRYNTLAGLLQSEAGSLLATGAEIDAAGWRFTVVSMQGRRIDKVRARPECGAPQLARQKNFCFPV